jgi:hypothetical protein
MQKSKNISKAVLLGVPILFTFFLILIIIFGYSGITKDGKFSWGYSAFSGITPTATAKAAQKVEFTVTDDQGQSKNYMVDFQDGKSAFELMKHLQDSNQGFKFDYSESSYGVYVTSVNGNKPEANKAFWEFKVNGVSSSVGVGTYMVKSGDKIQFVLTAINFDTK